jgi:hypothetical protein
MNRWNIPIDAPDDPPPRRRFQGFLFYLFVVNMCAAIIFGGTWLFEAAREAAGACGPKPPTWQVTERMKIVLRCPHPVAQSPRAVVQSPKPENFLWPVNPLE